MFLRGPVARAPCGEGGPCVLRASLNRWPRDTTGRWESMTKHLTWSPAWKFMNSLDSIRLCFLGNTFLWRNDYPVLGFFCEGGLPSAPEGGCFFEAKPLFCGQRGNKRKPAMLAGPIPFFFKTSSSDFSASKARGNGVAPHFFFRLGPSETQSRPPLWEARF